MFRLLVAVFTVLAAALPGRAQAVEVKCIEASKYKYVWQLFENDPRRFAAYLHTDPARLPNPEFCRAALVTGGMAKDEAGKLVDFVIANQGWLATLYLESGGGSIAEGVMLSLVTRMFWLKTRASFEKPIVYAPDFMLAPLDARLTETAVAAPDRQPGEPEVNWSRFVQSTRALPQATQGSGITRCVSSCSMVFSAGIDRRGVVYLHRPRNTSAFAQPGDAKVSLSQVLESLQGAERFQVALFDKMDSGENFIRTYRTTATNITVPATTSRLPSYVSDLLLQGCGSDAAQLEDLEMQTRSAIGYIGWSAQGFVDTARLRGALRRIHERQSAVESCVAALHEKERLRRYDIVCARVCTRESVMNALRREYAAMVARATPPRPAPPAAPPVSR